jgi:hypothetical protein
LQHGRAPNPFYRPAVAAALISLSSVSAWAQPAPAQAEPTLPSLDELLGLDAADEGLDPNQRALDRKLNAEEAGERFQQAVGLMGDAAARIGARDLGVQTQRLQEEILRNLDQVIESAKQNQGGGSGSSSSSSSQQSQQQPSQSTQRQAGSPGSESDSEQMAPGLTGVEMAPGVAPDGVTWGNLPERDREAVTQGVSDRYSALYRRMTELYYRKLAEREEDRR